MAFSGVRQKKQSCALFLIRISVLLTQVGLSGRESEGGLEDNLVKFASNHSATIVLQATVQRAGISMEWTGSHALVTSSYAPRELK